MDGNAGETGKDPSWRDISRFVCMRCDVNDRLHWEYREFYIAKGSAFDQRLVRDKTKAK